MFRIIISKKDQTNRSGVSGLTGMYAYGYSSIAEYDIYTTTEDGKLPNRFKKYNNVTNAVKIELENLHEEINQISDLKSNE